jgi:outer membrane protein insertion porin family
LKTTPSNLPRAFLARLFLALALGFAAAATAYAQGSGPLAPTALTPAAPTAPRVNSITVKFVGPANVSEQVVRANMQLQEGSTLEDSLIDRDIRFLYRTGQFEFIEFKRGSLVNGRIDLVVEVTPKFRVSTVDFEGNKAVKARRLAKEAKTKTNLPLDERQVKEDAEKIREYYQKSGYNQAKVEYRIERNRTTGLGRVIFAIDEGAKVRISRVEFDGNTVVSSRKLRKAMETRSWNWFSWITGSGRYRDDEFETDLDKLRDLYREKGFLDVNISADKVLFTYPSPSRLVITIPVVEGRQYKVGNITISGNTLHKTEVLLPLLKTKTGDIFAPSAIEKDQKTLEDFIGKDGYVDARVRIIRKPNLESGAIDVEYQYTEGDKFFVESIRIEGNTKTKSIVILRELALGPGEVFNTVRMNNSKLRLENTRFFEETNVSPESTNLPGRRNLKIAVKEGRTGNLSFGAGFSSLESAIVFAEVSQSNFDLFNRKSFFQGDGQKFRIRLQLGSRSSEATLNFEEPWLFERELALGFNLYRTSSDYYSNLYSETRLGAEVYLRKRLFELVEGRLGYTYEVVGIEDVDPVNAPFLVLEEGNRSVSKVTFKLLRDTRDRLFNTTRGNRAEITTELAGGPFAGETDYYRLEFRGAQYYPTFETLNQVVSFIGRTGVIDNYGDSANVPYFDRMFLGGPGTLRGFEFRNVGPKAGPNNDPIGGKTYGFGSAEYSFEVVDPLRIAVFYDIGFVNADAYDFDTTNYNDNFGIGLRLMIGGAPLSLDFGIPITSSTNPDGSSNDDGLQFNFSFGTRF